jgi:hypothetical protein
MANAVYRRVRGRDRRAGGNFSSDANRRAGGKGGKTAFERATTRERRETEDSSTRIDTSQWRICVPVDA